MTPGLRSVLVSLVILWQAFPVRTIKLGPIEKRDFEIDVVASSNMPHPLLGQTFFGDYQYTIDYDNKLIHFVRR
ncbi:MAG: hypothetical protein IPJ49_13905 [Candidatus Obscuribacter sp.]|nr:hypothetical protein [Candidatus Obscuribacter sp.]